MRHVIKVSSLVSCLLMLGGCASNRPLSTVEGIATERVDQTRYPTAVIGVDGQRLASPYGGPVAIAPGRRRIELIALPTRDMREPAIIRFDLAVEPCTQYFIVAAKSSPLSKDWMPVVDRTERVSKCDPEDELRKASESGKNEKRP